MFGPLAPARRDRAGPAKGAEMADGNSQASASAKRKANIASWRARTKLVRGGLNRSEHRETAEALSRLRP